MPITAWERWLLLGSWIGVGGILWGLVVLAIISRVPGWPFILFMVTIPTLMMLLIAVSIMLRMKVI